MMDQDKAIAHIEEIFDIELLKRELRAKHDEIVLVRRQNQNLLDELAERTHEWAALKKELAEYRNRETAKEIVQTQKDKAKLKNAEWPDGKSFLRDP